MSGTVRAFGRPNSRFTIVSNDLIRDTRLKSTPFRVAVYVMSHADDFVLTQESIGRALKLDRGTVRTAMVRLEELGYLFRVPAHSAAGRQPDDLFISQEPMTPDEWEAAVGSPSGKSPHGKTPRGKTPQRKEINSKKTKTQEDQPSGGDVADAPPPQAEVEEPEDEMPRTPEQQESLFAVEKAKKPRKAPALKDGPAAVVAAFVESYTAHHGGRRPLGSDIGKVGRAAKLIMGRQEATQEQLVTCATNMGKSEWANLTQELKFFLSRTTAKPQARYATGHDDPAWDAVQTSVQGPACSDEEFAELFGVGA